MVVAPASPGVTVRVTFVQVLPEVDGSASCRPECPKLGLAAEPFKPKQEQIPAAKMKTGANIERI